MGTRAARKPSRLAAAILALALLGLGSAVSSARAEGGDRIQAWHAPDPRVAPPGVWNPYPPPPFGPPARPYRPFQHERPAVCDRGDAGGTLAGIMIGAGVGGVLGSRLGDRPGDPGSTIAGMLMGAVIGGAIGQSLDHPRCR